MQTRKRIPYGSKIDVVFAENERDLILNDSLAGPDLTRRLQRAPEIAGYFTARYSLDDLEELLGFIAAEANHAKAKRLKGQLDRLFDRLTRIMDQYEDGAEGYLQVQFGNEQQMIMPGVIKSPLKKKGK